MTDIHDAHTALGDVAARTLSNATKTVPMMGSITPRWLVHLLQWVPVEAGIYRVNKVKAKPVLRSIAPVWMKKYCRKPMSITKNGAANTA
jgi:hypothetical protein